MAALALAGLFTVLELLFPNTLPPLLGFILITALLGSSWWLRTPNLPPSLAAPVVVPPAPAVGSVNTMVKMLSGSVDSINQVTALQAAGAKEQVDLIGRTNTLLGDFIDLSSRVQDQARDLTQTAKQAAENSEGGQAAIQQAIHSMNEIRQQVSAIATTILALAQFTQRIDDIIGLVSEIATQSNLLALNASIEAARAGTQGRGFAVVADEVRSLSRQSTQSANQVRVILSQIQSVVKDVIRATEDGLQRVDTGMERTQIADREMAQLAANVASAHKAMSRVYDIIRQQVDGLEEITLGIERIDRVTQRNLESTRSVEAVAGELTRLAGDLRSVMNQ